MRDVWRMLKNGVKIILKNVKYFDIDVTIKIPKNISILLNNGIKRTPGKRKYVSASGRKIILKNVKYTARLTLNTAEKTLKDVMSLLV